VGCASQARVKQGLLWAGRLVAVMLAATLGLVGSASAGVVTNANDALRTGWYPDEGSITPSLVSGPTWGQLWSQPVDGQVYAQPLLAPTGTLIVTTEKDNIYGLDPATGSQKWMDSLAPNGPWDPADVGCSDLVPYRGSTATPVIDTSTNTAYVTYKTYDANHNAVWFMDARSVDTGQRAPGAWPVQLSGAADNDPSLTFNSANEDQRTGLLLMDGVVYAGFGSECDHSPWDGWVLGVSTSTKQVTARWATVTNGDDGGGVWQAGVGLSTDRDGSILLSTGNGGAPIAPAAGSSPPSSCGECAIRLDVQPNGKLQPVDFFAPFDALQLDQTDTDFGSTGVVGLPDQYFGTASVPHLALAAGKEGYVYLLNRDDLGGYQQAPGGGDAVVDRQGPFGAVFGRPGIWPGDGGYIYIPTSCCQNGGGNLDVYKYGLNSSGNPSLSEVATSPDVFGFGSGSPVITSDGTTSGSALVWIIWAANRMGNGAQLRAYDPTPANGQPVLRWSASIGNATNYSTPGVGAGRLYVGTRDGTVVAFGSPVSSPLGGSGLTFPRTTIGSSSGPQTLTITANHDNVKITNLSSSDSSEFVLGTPSPAVGTTLNAGEQMTVPVTFSPGHAGPIGGQVTASTSADDVSFPVSGTGQDNGPSLAASTRVASLGGTSVGGHLTGSFVLTNQGSQTVTIQGVDSPAAPFSTDARANVTIDPGNSITVNVSFDPTSTGQFTDSIGFDSNSIHGRVNVVLSATAGTPGDLQFSSEVLDFGPTQVGTTSTRTFTITNAGGTPVTIEKSKPPFGGAFAATTTLPEGTSIAPGQTVTESVTFSPTATGSASGSWPITGNDTSGAHQVQFTGTGSSGSPGGGSGSTSPPGKKPSRPVAPKLLPGVATTAHLGNIFISYTANVAGVSRFVLQRAVVGRRGAHGCVATTARNRSRPTCTRFVTVKSFSHRDHTGAVRLRLGAFVALSKLAPGRYRLESVLLDSAGGKHTFDTALRIILPLRRHAARDAAPGIASVGDLLRQLAALLSVF
jgi:HYDIN/CFA65/VesB family protein/putative pyrroloquinoline-quinone-binding quinoprotein